MKKIIPFEKYTRENVPMTKTISDQDSSICIPFIPLTGKALCNTGVRMMIGHQYMITGVTEDEDATILATFISFIRPLIISDQTISYDNHKFVFIYENEEFFFTLKDVIKRNVYVYPVDIEDLQDFEKSHQLIS